MEGIIIMVVLFIVSSILNGAKKKQQNQGPMPPFNNQPTKHDHDAPRQPEKRKSLEDFANEVFQQLSEKTEPNTSRRAIENQKATEEGDQSISEKAVTQQIAPKIRPGLDSNRSSARGSTISAKSSTSETMKQNEIGAFVPTTRNELVHAIITTEILGPPKAKRK
ncbi:hypothetical protein [Ureibacillus sinduriensis]|uniref:Uncharacterized protein n=1 Tax=Ureibacillus sinduriensis BLB-1 = JCM 15800 TaxID=1384057 RepID=A0A0A3HQ48_9BACL|nr:hypothetical protein [Ureibacillus sinduriensis]KGR74529.1 hypothetical protein CD33_15650 [Ureibacillus sinduriensis BLB-1 = JCM 15800]